MTNDAPALVAPSPSPPSTSPPSTSPPSTSPSSNPSSSPRLSSHRPSARRSPIALGRWRLSPWQWLVVTLATIAPLLVAGTLAAGLAGVITVEAIIEAALVFGEDPGMLTFGAMFLASPVQWATGRTQVPVRKYLGIVFFLLALSNGAMFVIESGMVAAFGAPFLIAGVIALLVATPLFLTSSRWSQRVLGMRRWRLLHRLTYVVALALVAHVLLAGELGLGSVLIIAGFVARVPAVRRWLVGRRLRRESRSN